MISLLLNFSRNLHKITFVTTTEKQFDSIILKCIEVFSAKMKDYGSAWRILRLPSLTDQIYIKAQRIRSLQTKKTSKINEGQVSEFIGIINYSIMSLVQIDDPGLIVLPTHRAIKSKLSNFICLQKLEKQFFIDKKSFSEWPNIVKKINSYNDNHIFGFANRKLGISGILRPIETLKFNDCWSEYSDQWKALDVSALHAFILNSIFDFNINSLFDKENIFYSHRENECIEKLDEDYNWVFFLRPTSIEQLIEIANNDEVMPPKSTFFYPKFLSGFINSEL